MLDKIDLNHKLSKQEYKKSIEASGLKLAFLQRECKQLAIPVLVLFEGWGASGKGTLISQLIAPLDPRGFKVFTIQKPSEEESMRPFLWRFWTKMPAKGRIHIMDRSWYRNITDDYKNELAQREVAYSEILNFEDELSSDGMVIIKFFLHISQEEQKERLKVLEKSPQMSWRVTQRDWKQNKNYDESKSEFHEMLLKTDSSDVPWYVIEAQDREYAAVKMMHIVNERLEEAIRIKKRETLTRAEESIDSKDVNPFSNGVLRGIDLDKALAQKVYKKRLKELQEELSKLHFEMYLKRIPVVLAFEGWDAGGKGGAIKRVVQNMDPRGYEVIPTAAPNDIEKAHHYLWRFWNAIPKAGHLTVFDRTWYGRVMVERVEGFCTKEEWKRAFKEINHMEEHLTNFGCVVLKFWMHIDKDEQEKRFIERQNNPDKQWKITDEDWRNREKWDEYEMAVDEMILRTSTPNAPWIIVEANDKYFARIKVLETVVDTLKSVLDNN